MLLSLSNKIINGGRTSSGRAISLGISRLLREIAPSMKGRSAGQKATFRPIVTTSGRPKPPDDSRDLSHHDEGHQKPAAELQSRPPAIRKKDGPDH